MTSKKFFTFLGNSLDPKRNLIETAPRPLLGAKMIVEYVFRIAGFFILLCLLAGLTLAACPKSAVMANLPFVLGLLFSFYIVLTTIGIPIYFLISEIEDTTARRIVGYMTTLVLFLVTLWFFAASPVFDLLLAYVGKIFPEAFDCSSGILRLDGEGQ